MCILEKIKMTAETANGNGVPEVKILYSWDLSSEVTNSSEVKKCKASIKTDERPIRFFRSLLLTDMDSAAGKAIAVGDGVLVASDGHSGHYVARVEKFFETGTDWKVNTKFAQVTWFFQQNEIAKRKLPGKRYPNEVFLCTAKVQDEIDAETIVDTCTIDSVPGCEDKRKQFFCRKSFDGRQFKELNSGIAVDDRKKANSLPLKQDAKTKESEVSIQSTPSAIKRKVPVAATPRKHSDCITKALITSPLAASSVRRYDACTVALDILDSSSGESDICEDSIQKVSRKKKTKATKHKVLKVPTESKPSATKRCNSALTKLLKIDKNTQNVGQETDRLLVKPQLPKQSSREKENQATVRPSNRLSIKKETKKRRLKTARNKTSLPSSGKGISDKSFGGDCPDEMESTKKMADKILDTEVDELKETVRRSLRLSHPRKAKRSQHVSTFSRRKSILPPSDESEDDESEFDDDVKDANVTYSGSNDDESNDSDLEEKARHSRTQPTPRKKKKSLAATKANPSSRLTKKRSEILRVGSRTPKNRKAFIPERETPVKRGTSDFERACEHLHVSAVPDSLPCREDQFQSIYSFIERRLSSGSGGCLYISGVPGTGKTATVMEVLSSLRESVEEELIEDFDYVEINGMRLTEPHQAYASILKQLKGTKATWEHAAQLLTKHFSTKSGRSTVLVVDELDLLWTRKQDVMYHLFDWPSLRHARLIVVAIANTMDLPERIMMNRVSSRLGLTRLSFSPYNYQQLQEIVSSRLRGIPVFEPDAVQLVARKVAAISGDARRCLDVCRRAVEIAGKEKRGSKLGRATIEHVHAALQEMFSSPMIMMISNSSVHEKLILRAMVAEFRRSGLEEATMGQIIEHHSLLAKVEGLPPCTVSSLIRVCDHLASSRIILLEMGRHDIYARVRLNISIDDVLFALNAS